MTIDAVAIANTVLETGSPLVLPLVALWYGLNLGAYLSATAFGLPAGQVRSFGLRPVTMPTRAPSREARDDLPPTTRRLLVVRDAVLVLIAAGAVVLGLAFLVAGLTSA